MINITIIIQAVFLLLALYFAINLKKQFKANNPFQAFMLDCLE